MTTIMNSTRPAAVLSFTALLLLVSSIHAYQDSNVYSWGSNPNTRFDMYWKDASNVIQDLEEFQSLHIKVEGCVWSECGVDNYDDDGEGHDGDSSWYQTRTQGFCANAAYSLYGIRKGTYHFQSCTKATFINSFFTYGGADVLANSLGLSVDQYYDDDSYGNAGCSEIEGESQSGSGDQDDDGAISSTMGCLASGQFVMANFQGDVCDGNNFLEATDTLYDYNRALNSVGCQKVWDLDESVTTDDYYGYSIAEKLLRTSWSCDIDLYPNTCPDPYGKKKVYSAVIRGAGNGAPVSLAVANARLQRPMRLISWLFLIFGVGLLFASYVSTNKERIRSSGGGAVGLLAIVGIGIRESASNLSTDISSWVASRRAALAKRSRKKKKREEDDDRRTQDGYVQEEDEEPRSRRPALTEEEQQELERERKELERERKELERRQKRERKEERRARRQERRERESGVASADADEDEDDDEGNAHHPAEMAI